MATLLDQLISTFRPPPAPMPSNVGPTLRQVLQPFKIPAPTPTYNPPPAPPRLNLNLMPRVSTSAQLTPKAQAAANESSQKDAQVTKLLFQITKQSPVGQFVKGYSSSPEGRVGNEGAVGLSSAEKLGRVLATASEADPFTAGGPGIAKEGLMGLGLMGGIKRSAPLIEDISRVGKATKGVNQELKTGKQELNLAREGVAATSNELSPLNRVGQKVKQILGGGTEPGLSLPPQPKPVTGNALTDSILPKSGISKIGTEQVANDSNSLLNKVKNKVNDIYTQALDRYHPISQLGKQAGQDQEMRNALTGHYGAGSTADYHTKFELAPILQQGNVNDLREYTIAKRDAELAGRGIKGSDANAANQVLTNLKTKLGPDGFAKVESQAQDLYKYQDQLVQKYLVNTGIMSKEAYAGMKANNQSYVPFRRVMDVVDEHLGTVPNKKGIGSVSSQDLIKGIKGSSRDIHDPLQSIVENTYKMVGLGKRQEVAKTIVGLKDKLPEGMITPFKGDASIGKKPVISLFENGKVQKYLVPPEVADAAKGLNEDQMNLLTKWASAPARMVRETATGINPAFMAPNIVRDAQSAFVNTGMNPLGYVKGLAHYLKQDDMYQQFLKSGGQTSRISLDRPFLKQSVEDLTATKTRGITVKKPSDLYHALEAMGQGSEQPTRIAMFEKAFKDNLKQGLSQEEAGVRAANTAQEGTVNFARHGSATPAVNALIPFLNARAQGVDRLVRTFKNDPKGAAVRLGLITQGPAVATYMWNRQFSGFNDSRVVTDNDKQNNYIIMIDNNHFLKIPKGDIGKVANPTEQFLSFLDHKGGDVAKGIGQALSSFSPIQNWGDITPAIIKPPLENAFNKNSFTGQPIVPDYKKDYPAGKQTTSSTSPIYNMIGEKLGVSPAQIQNIMQGYFTGFASMGQSLTSPFVPDQYKSPQNTQGDILNKIPILNRFVGGEKRTIQEQQAVDQKKLNSLDISINNIKGGVSRGDLTVDEGVKQIQALQQKAGQPVDTEARLRQHFEIAGINKQNKTQNTQLDTDAQTKLSELDKLNDTDYEKAVEDIHQNNPDLYDAMVRAKNKVSLTSEEKDISSLGVKNGDRAKFIYKEMQGKGTQKEAYIQNLIDKKVITQDIYDQITQLKESGYNPQSSPAPQKQGSLMDSFIKPAYAASDLHPNTPEEFKQPILKAAQENNIPPKILSNLLNQETGFNNDLTSPVGAGGIAQFMPETAQRFGVDIKDPVSGINGAAKYLAYLYSKFHSWPLALAGYNSGEGNVMKYGGIPPFKETQNYVKSILGQ